MKTRANTYFIIHLQVIDIYHNFFYILRFKANIRRKLNLMLCNEIVLLQWQTSCALSIFIILIKNIV